MDKQFLINDAAKENSEMLLRRFVAAVGFDYVQHDKKHTSQIHPDFSEETLLLWQEVENRLHEPTVLEFDFDSAYSELTEKCNEQAKMCEKADSTSSYHYGLMQGFSLAAQMLKKCTRKKLQ